MGELVQPLLDALPVLRGGRQRGVDDGGRQQPRAQRRPQCRVSEPLAIAQGVHEPLGERRIVHEPGALHPVELGIDVGRLESLGRQLLPQLGLGHVVPGDGAQAHALRRAGRAVGGLLDVGRRIGAVENGYPPLGLRGAGVLRLRPARLAAGEVAQLAHRADQAPTARRACTLPWMDSTLASSVAAGAGAGAPMPSLARILRSMSAATSGFVSRKSRAFSLPCPSWSPSYVYQAPDFLTMPCSTPKSIRLPSREMPVP